jgi:hypothetical protein
VALIVVDMLDPYEHPAAIHDHLAEASLEMMERNMSAELCRAAECSLG